MQASAALKKTQRGKSSNEKIINESILKLPVQYVEDNGNLIRFALLQELELQSLQHHLNPNVQIPCYAIQIRPHPQPKYNVFLSGENQGKQSETRKLIQIQYFETILITKILPSKLLILISREQKNTSINIMTQAKRDYLNKNNTSTFIVLSYRDLEQGWQVLLQLK